MTPPPFSPSGAQHPIAFGDHQATIVEVGGGIREYRIGSRDVLHPYERDQMCDGAHGAPLIPWPNRLADGHYSFDDIEYQVPLSEPEKRNAIHGLLRWRSWTTLEHDPDHVAMGCRLRPMTGYPFALDVRVDYRLSAEGLTVELSATNGGPHAAPFGSGQHPYLSPGTGRVDDCTLRFAAATRILVDDERQLPDGIESVAGTPYDFSAGKRIGDLEVDHAFTDLERDGDGRAWLSLTGADGATVELWTDSAYPLLQIYTGDQLTAERRRSGLGTEPMTCPPNAFQSGRDVIRLEPGQTTRSAWGVRLAD